jgi:hypothetical protein
LKDLETFKSDFSSEEYEELKKESVEKLLQNKQLLEKMQAGDLTTTTALDSAKQVISSLSKKIYEILSQNYNVKDLLNSYLATESNCLREKLSQLKRDLTLYKLSSQEYESSVSQILEALSKITKVL